MDHPQTTAELPAGDAVPATVSKTGLSIGAYLIRRLQDYGIGHVFGIPGDYVLQFYAMLDRSPLEVVTTTREDCAGFAADAYARVHGMGAVCVTYCVGGLSLCNSVAGAYAEKSPVVVITGSPGLKERHNNPLLHHLVRDFRTQYDVFEKLCIAGTELDDPRTAFHEIDRVLAAASRFKRPVYIEIPRDMVEVVPEVPHQFQTPQVSSDPAVLGEAVAEAERWLNSCQRPAIVAGVEIHRFGLQDELLALAEGSQIGITTTMLGKSVISETNPLFVGLYEGAMGDSKVTQFVEQSDCLLLLGTFMTDINLGIYTANLDPGKCIYATSEQLRVRHHHFHDVLLVDFLRELAARRPRPPKRALPDVKDQASEKFVLQAEEPIGIKRLITRLNESLDDETVVIADIGDSLFAASELVIRGRTEFLSPAYYTSMGFSVPAALGTQMGRPDLRTIVIAGDGAFQMTGSELSSLVRWKMPTIVIVLNNGGYGTERFLHPGEFDSALRQALADTSGPSLIHVHLDRNDHSTALKRLTERLSKRV
jgi:indolepyruvate decarboxylase